MKLPRTPAPAQGNAGPKSDIDAAHPQRARHEGKSIVPSSVKCYSRTATGLHAVPPADLPPLFQRVRSAAGPEPLLWIDIVCPGEAEETLLMDQLGLHELAVEDVMRGRQRPKLDRYKGYVFLVLYSASINRERRRSALEELHIFIGHGWILTVHDHKLEEVSQVIGRWRANESAYPTTGTLAHALVDLVVDSFRPVIDFMGGEVDEIEHRILVQPTEAGMAALLDLRKEVATMRRVLAPVHDLVHDLVRRDETLVDASLQPFFMDVLDHARREVEELDALRDTLAATLNAYLSVSANQLNQTVRIMAGWSIILMAMAWIAGVYGMNFRFMPELHWRYGYAWALGTMLAVGIALVLFFRHRKWL